MSSDTPVHRDRPIHWKAVHLAFGADRDHPAQVGRVVRTDEGSLLVDLAGGARLQITVEDPRLRDALQRDDLCRWDDGALLALVNIHYGLIGVAFGAPTPPRRLVVRSRVSRLEGESAVEIPGEAPQPGWLLFRCVVSRAPGGGRRDDGSLLQSESPEDRGEVRLSEGQPCEARVVK